MSEKDKLLDTDKRSKSEDIDDKNDSQNGQDVVDLGPFIYPIASFLIPMLVFIRTACRTLYIGDCGDYATASHMLSIPHPPGYPLFTLLGHLFQNLPIPGGISEIAWRMNMMTAFYGALTTFMVYLIIFRVTKYNWLAFFAALAVAFTRSFWSQAVITEVYTLNTFFITLQLYLLIVRRDSMAKNTLIWMGLALGLSLAHHPSIAIFFPAYVLLSWIRRDHNLTRILLVAMAFGLALIKPWAIFSILLLIPHEILIRNRPGIIKTSSQKSAMSLGIFLFLLSLCFYAYHPIVGYANPVTGPQQFETPRENWNYFLETVTRKVYDYKAMTPGQQLTTTPMVFNQYLKIVWDDFVALAFIFFIGFIALRRRCQIGWLVFICYISFMLTILFYPSGDILRAPLQNLEVVMYHLMLPAQLMYVLFGFIGIGYLLDWIPGYAESVKDIDTGTTVEKKIQYLNLVAILSLVMLVMVIMPFSNWRYNDKSENLVAYNYARNVMISAPENSFVLNTGDETFLFWYMKYVENYLPEKNIELQNWIHNIRDFEILTDQANAIRDVLFVVLNREVLAESNPELRTELAHMFNYDHYCTTFLTPEIQQDKLFSPFDVVMRGLVYEFVLKPPEYYAEHHYSIHPHYGIVPNALIIHDNLLMLLTEQFVNLGMSKNGAVKLINALGIPRPDYESFVESRAEKSYFDDDYPGMRIRMDHKIPYGDLYWDSIFEVTDISHEFPDEEVILDFDLNPMYKDPQEQEIIGRYQEMFHNIGMWNIHKAGKAENEDEIAEHYFWAIRSFWHEIVLRPSDRPGWLALGNAYLQVRNYRSAIDALTMYRDLVLDDPNVTMQQRSEAHYYLAIAYLFQGTFNRAQIEIDRALIYDPNHERAKGLRQEIIRQEMLFREKMKRFEGMDEDFEMEDMIDDEITDSLLDEITETPALPEGEPE